MYSDSTMWPVATRNAALIIKLVFEQSAHMYMNPVIKTCKQKLKFILLVTYVRPHFRGL